MAVDKQTSSATTEKQQATAEMKTQLSCLCCLLFLLLSKHHRTQNRGTKMFSDARLTALQQLQTKAAALLCRRHRQHQMTTTGGQAAWEQRHFQSSMDCHIWNNFLLILWHSPLVPTSLPRRKKVSRPLAVTLLASVDTPAGERLPQDQWASAARRAWGVWGGPPPAAPSPRCAQGPGYAVPLLPPVRLSIRQVSRDG